MKVSRATKLFMLGGGFVCLAACGGPSPLERPNPTPTVAPTPLLPAIMAAGDISCDATPQLPCRSKATSDLILAERAARANVIALPLGDNQYESGTLGEFNAYYDATWGRLNAFARPVAGNHEYQTRGATGYYDYFLTRNVNVGSRSEGWYSYNLGNWHFIALNSNCADIGGCAAGSPQFRWLESDLAQNRQTCAVAYMHHPFQSTGVNGSTPALLPLVRLLYQYNVELALSGHDHDYERFVPITPDLAPDQGTGIRFFVVGTGGRDLREFARDPFPHTAYRNRDHFGVLRIVLRDSSYDWAFVNTESSILDSGSGVCF